MEYIFSIYETFTLRVCIEGEQMETKTFKIKYLGFYSSFDEKNNFISDSIKRFGNIELSENPDYVFYSVFSNEYLLYQMLFECFLQEKILLQIFKCVVMQ